VWQATTVLISALDPEGLRTKGQVSALTSDVYAFQLESNIQSRPIWTSPSRETARHNPSPEPTDSGDQVGATT
jgi:hypothetical protein